MQTAHGSLDQEGLCRHPGTHRTVRTLGFSCFLVCDLSLTVGVVYSQPPSTASWVERKNTQKRLPLPSDWPSLGTGGLPGGLSGCVPCCCVRARLAMPYQQSSQHGGKHMLGQHSHCNPNSAGCKFWLCFVTLDKSRNPARFSVSAVKPNPRGQVSRMTMS